MYPVLFLPHIAWSMSILVHGQHDYGLGCFLNSFSVIRPCINRIASCWRPIPRRYIQGLSKTHTPPFIFCLQHMIKGITSARFKGLLVEFFPEFVLGHWPTRKLDRVMFDCRIHGVTLKVYPTHAPHSSFASQHMINAITSTWSTRLWLGIFPKFVFGHEPTQKPYRVADSRRYIFKAISNAHVTFIFCLQHIWSKALLVNGRQDSGLDFFSRSCGELFWIAMVRKLNHLSTAHWLPERIHRRYPIRYTLL
jgi:hypothetical protein